MPVFCWVGRSRNLTPTQQKVGIFDCRSHFMISIHQCREIVGALNLTDKEIEQIRDALYILVGNVLAMPGPEGVGLLADSMKEARQDGDK